MSGFIGPELVEQIRQANDIVELIQSYIPLKRTGGTWKALCPFHNEKTPSFHVNPQRQTYYCFGCNKGGDVFNFLKDYEGLSFFEAAQRLADRASIELTTTLDPGTSQRSERKKALLQLHEQIAHRWHKVLLEDPQGEKARTYLQSRNVSLEAIKHFQLGYAPLGWDHLIRWSRGKNYDIPLLEEGGLILQKQTGKDYYDRFRGRLMFPIHDVQGRCIAFSGRLIEGDTKVGKYINSPETQLFKKGHTIYGLDKAKRAILKTKSAIICEGQLDLIACHMAGIENVVAPQGTALTLQHATLLKRYAEEIVLCFDADEAGQNAAIRSMDDLIASGLNLRVVKIPHPHDPDSYIQEHGHEAFSQRVDQADGFFDFLLQRLRASHPQNTDKDRMLIVQSMGQAVAKTRHAVIMDTYAQKTAHLLNVDVDAVRQEFKQASRTPTAAVQLRESLSPMASDEPEAPLSAPLPPLPQCNAQEYWLMKLVLSEEEEEPLEWLFSHLDLSWIQHPIVRTVLVGALDAHANHKKPEAPEIIRQCDHPEASSFITEALAEARSIPSRERQYEELLKRLRNRFIDHQIQTRKSRLATLADNSEEQIQTMTELMSLRHSKNQPLTPLAEV